MKKLTALVLALVMCFGLVACGSTPAPSSTPASESTSQAEATNENFVDPVNGWDVYDELIDQIRTETDLEKRAEMMHQAEDILMETGAILPLYFYTLYVVWEGCMPVMRVAAEYRLRFTVITSLAIILCPWLIEWVFTWLLRVLN